MGLTGSQLNPRFVAEMMGFPPDWSYLPFLTGNASPVPTTESSQSKDTAMP